MADGATHQARDETAVRSLWAATGRPAPRFPALTQDVTCEVAIVGGGYSGLSAAARLAELGVESVVLEARSVGWGASGRNGGVVSSKFRPSFPAMARQHGLDTARRMHGLGKEAVDTVASLVNRFAISDAGFARQGNLRCAHNRQALQGIQAEAEWMRRELQDDSLTLLSAEDVARETGSQAFHGGVMTQGAAGTIHPLNYVRGLAEGVSRQAGVAVYEQSQVNRIHRQDDGLVVETDGGSVRARRLLIATNAYSEFSQATARVQRSLVPFRSAIIATEPLPGELRHSLLSEGRSYGETRRMMRWFRKVEGRLVFGGRGAFGKEDSPAAFAALHRGMTSLFPQVRDIPLAYRWSGHVGMTLDQLPHVGWLEDRICVAAGYNGSGVAMASLLGHKAAEILAGQSPDLALLEAARFNPVPLYPVRELGIRLMAAWYTVLDALGR